MEHLDDNFNETSNENSQADSTGSNDEKLIRYKQQMQGWQTKAQQESAEKTAAEERAERYRQSLINTNYKRVYTNGEINVDALSDLLSEDPDLANDVASKFEINGKSVSSADEIISYLGGGNATRANGTLEKEQLINEITNKLKYELTQDQVIKSVRTQFAILPDGKRELAEKHFNELIEGRKVSPEKAQEYAKMAMMYVSAMDNNSASKKDKKLAQIASLNLGGGSVGNSFQPDDGMFSDDD